MWRIPLVATAVLMSVFVGCTTCLDDRRSGPSPLPVKAPHVGTWPRHRYAPEPLDLRPTLDLQTPLAAQIRAALTARHGEPFWVIQVSSETSSAPGMPGGFAGSFLAHPAANPALVFGGSVGEPLVDSYACIRAVQPVLAWTQTVLVDRVVVVSHPCERTFADEPGRVDLWIFDDSGADVDGRATEMQNTLDAVLQPLAHASAPLLSATVTMSFHPPGTAPLLRKILTTSRRPEHARHAVRHRERAAVALVWQGGVWTRSDVSQPRATGIERDVAAAVRAHLPASVAFEVLVPGPASATVADIALRDTVRENVDVYVRVTGPHDEQALADGIVAAQRAVDPRLLLRWQVTLCDEDAERPWAAPERCQSGWDEFTVFTLQDPRSPPEFWPHPPAG